MSGAIARGGLHGAIETTSNGRVVEVTLANPPDNRLTPAMIEALSGVMDRFEGDDDLDVLVITGAQRAFSKGFEIDTIKTIDATELGPVLALSNRVFTRVARSAKPTVAAISGACTGGGLELALACHFRVCAEKARLGLPEVWLDLVPGLGGFYRLARLVGAAKALELVALGDLITADEALRLNIVSRVFPRDDFGGRVAAFVGALGGLNQRAVREIIRLAGASMTRGEDENIRLAADTFVELFTCAAKTSS